jgi:hypothetical protein
MAGKTAYFEKAVINLALRNTAFSAPATVYVALFTVAPTDAYTQAVPDGTEVSGNGYARQVATFSAPGGSPSATANDSLITFPAALPSGWGTINAVGIFDALTTGNLIYWNTLTAPKTVGASDIFQFGISALTLSED